MACTIQKTWLLGEDFNVIRSVEEKLYRLTVTKDEIEDFNHYINISNF